MQEPQELKYGAGNGFIIFISSRIYHELPIEDPDMVMSLNTEILTCPWYLHVGHQGDQSAHLAMAWTMEFILVGFSFNSLVICAKRCGWFFQSKCHSFVCHIHTFVDAHGGLRMNTRLGCQHLLSIVALARDKGIVENHGFPADKQDEKERMTCLCQLAILWFN